MKDHTASRDAFCVNGGLVPLTGSESQHRTFYRGCKSALFGEMLGLIYQGFMLTQLWFNRGL